MPDLQFQKVVQSNIDVLDFGVRDLEAIVTASGTILYSSTGYGGGGQQLFPVQWWLSVTGRYGAV